MGHCCAAQRCFAGIEGRSTIVNSPEQPHLKFERDSEGPSYCFGGDLSDGWMVRSSSAGNAAPGPEAQSPATIISAGLLLNRSLAKPLIAGINGPCLGG